MEKKKYESPEIEEVSLDPDENVLDDEKLDSVTGGEYDSFHRNVPRTFGSGRNSGC